MDIKEIRKLISTLTLEEKAGLCSGLDFWHTKKVERKNIPNIMMSDGPHGLRKQNLEADHLGINNSIKAVCFPTGSAIASSFDKNIANKIGRALGEECMAEDVAVVLGPAVNIKRSPLCGRNFEYMSEDPYLAGKMAAAFINGVQEHGIGTSIKHFALNNQEHFRHNYNSVVEERAAREIYLKPFEIAVKESKPKTVMCSYNLINGVQTSENKELLTQILRDEWGFDGLVMSDWGAVRDRALGVEAGLDLEMPGFCGAEGYENDKVIVEAVKNGSLSREDLDKCVERVLKLVFDYHEARERYLSENPVECAENASMEESKEKINKASKEETSKEGISREESVVSGIKKEVSKLLKKASDDNRMRDGGTDCYMWDKIEHHIIAANTAAECMVLLKNENKVLPLEESEYLCMVGGFAKNLRFQGGGSSHINCVRIESIISACQGNYHTTYEKGFDYNSDVRNDKDFEKAISEARNRDKVIVFAGLPDSYESEGYDREHIDLPSVQNELIEELTKVCPHVIVVLMNGSAVTMPWLDKVEAVLMAGLCGEGAGRAIMDVLYGRVNPSGRLSETYPLRLEDTPSYLEFGGDSKTITYREGIYVGYRYYTAKKMPVLFPFGYGLSYTKFSYAPIKTDCDSMKDDEIMEVKVDVINEGPVVGKEVVQLYVSKVNSKIRRPVRELKGFEKVEVKVKERKCVTFMLDKSSFAYYDEDLGDWYTEPGEYDIQICKNADEVIASKRVSVYPKEPKRTLFDENTSNAELMEYPEAVKVMKPIWNQANENDIQKSGESEAEMELITDKLQGEYFKSDVLRMLVNMGKGFTREKLQSIIDELNNACWK